MEVLLFKDMGTDELGSQVRKVLSFLLIHTEKMGFSHEELVTLERAGMHKDPSEGSYFMLKQFKQVLTL